MTSLGDPQVLVSYLSKASNIGTSTAHFKNLNPYTARTRIIYLCGGIYFFSQGVILGGVGEIKISSLFSSWTIILLIINLVVRSLTVKWLCAASDFTGRRMIIVLSCISCIITEFAWMYGDLSSSLFVYAILGGIFDVVGPLSLAWLSDHSYDQLHFATPFSLYIGGTQVTSTAIGCLLGLFLLDALGRALTFALAMIGTVFCALFLFCTAPTATGTGWIGSGDDSSYTSKCWSALDCIAEREAQKQQQRLSATVRTVSSSYTDELPELVNVINAPHTHSRCHHQKHSLRRTFSRLLTFLRLHTPLTAFGLVGRSATPLLWLALLLAVTAHAAVQTVFLERAAVSVGGIRGAMLVEAALATAATGIGMCLCTPLALRWACQPLVGFVGLLVSGAACLLFALSGSGAVGVGGLHWPGYLGAVLYSTGAVWLPTLIALAAEMYPCDMQGEVQGVVAQVVCLASLAGILLSSLVMGLCGLLNPLFGAGAADSVALILYGVAAVLLVHSLGIDNVFRSGSSGFSEGAFLRSVRLADEDARAHSQRDPSPGPSQNPRTKEFETTRLLENHHARPVVAGGVLVGGRLGLGLGHLCSLRVQPFSAEDIELLHVTMTPLSAVSDIDKVPSLDAVAAAEMLEGLDSQFSPGSEKGLDDSASTKMQQQIGV